MTQPSNQKSADSNDTVNQQQSSDMKLPSKMEAVQLMAYNQDLTKALKTNTIDVPAIADDEILIQIKYVSVNPGDWRIAQGVASKVQPFNLPRVMGSDFSGTIIKCGKNIDFSKYPPTADVFGSLGWQPKEQGCLSQYIACKTENLMVLPNQLQSDEKKSDEKCNDDHDADFGLMHAAGAGIAGITSYKSLIETGNIIKGQKILILGGSSACGLFGIQICKAVGLSEIHVTSSKIDLCQSLGATKVYNYKNIKDEKEQWYKILANGNLDVVYDCVATGGEHYRLCTENSILNPKTGKYVSLVGDLNKKMGVLGYGTMANMALSQINRKFWSMFNNPDYYVTDFKVTQKDIQLLYQFIRDNDIKVIIDEESPFPFSKENVDKAFQKSVQQKAHGKLILSFVD